MTGNYKLTFKVWPYSVKPAEQPMYDKSVGDQQKTMIFCNCTDFHHAYNRAIDFLGGVTLNNCVWNVHIVSLEHVP